MDSPIPLTRDLVFIGGGHAHALVLRQWGMAPLPGARLTLINPDPVAPYTGMLPGHVAGHYGRDDLMIDLVRLARFAGARLILGKAAGLDLKAKQIHVPGRPPIRYDVASIDVGITADMPDLPGFRDYGIGAKPLDRFADAWDAYIAQVKSGEKTGQVAVIGGGVAGCELALAMHHRLTDMGVSPHISIIERATALQGADEKSQTQLRDRLKSASIVLKEQCSVQRLTAEGVVTETNDVIPAELTIGAAGARPHDWLAHQGLEHEAGFLTVDRFLRSVSDHSIYAAGDCAHMKGSPRPKAGVFAVRQAPILLANLRADLSRGPRRVFKPQKRFLKLISLGGKDAIAEGYGINPSGPWLWRLKDKIDRDFMHKLSTLPRMAQASPHGRVAAGVAQALSEKPLCGGCGAKVSGSSVKIWFSVLPETFAPQPPHSGFSDNAWATPAATGPRGE
ncbi:MAG: FAD-dependent oxidoreductase, partial [Pseudomonadota bacterium]